MGYYPTRYYREDRYYESIEYHLKLGAFIGNFIFYGFVIIYISCFLFLGFAFISSL